MLRVGISVRTCKNGTHDFGVDVKVGLVVV